MAGPMPVMLLRTILYNPRSPPDNSACSLVYAEVRLYLFATGCANLGQGICAGKDSVAAFLVKHQEFTRLYLKHPTPSSAKQEPPPCDTSPHHLPIFETAASLLDFVTKRWQQRWVTTDIWNEGVVDVFRRRPCFLLVSVDAPVSLRWKRLKDRLAPQHRAFSTTDGPEMREKRRKFTDVGGLCDQQ